MNRSKSLTPKSVDLDWQRKSRSEGLRIAVTLLEDDLEYRSQKCVDMFNNAYPNDEFELVTVIVECNNKKYFGMVCVPKPE